MLLGSGLKMHNDMIHQEQRDPVIKKVKGFYLNKHFLDSSSPFSTWRGNQMQTLPPVCGKARKARVRGSIPGH
jgi:hypothetical protein